jgi:uncharacterized protein (TIGR01244 family)
MRFRLVLAAAAIAAVSVAALHAQQVTKQTIPGITNFARLETTVACGGATSAEAMPELKKMGFNSIINLRQASEAGANIPAAEAAAKSVNLAYVHIPFNAQAPDPTVADRFLQEVVKPANQPVYIHCAGGNRAATMWFIKRLVVDKWNAERAEKEAAALGMTSPALKQFAIDYASKRAGA